jgi:hypothetical protein
MTGQTPAYYRARINAIEQLIKEIPVSDEKNNDRVLLRNGFIPEGLVARFDELIAEQSQTRSAQENEPPLSFTELCSFNNWFAMHPEKIAGIEYVTTSREFPLMIKGTKEEIIETVSMGLHDDKDKRLRIVQAQAKAKLKLLELTKLKMK